MRETVKKSDGFPVQRLHFEDVHGDKLIAELDVEAPAAMIDTDEFSYVVLFPDQLRRMADWVERSWDKTEAWRESPEGRAYLDSL